MPVPVQHQEIADLFEADRLRHPAIYETFSQPVAYTDMLERIQQTRERSMFWGNEGRFAAASADLMKVAGLPNGWDSYGAEAPAPVSVSTASHILSILRRWNVPPSRIAASAEGGVGICFVEGDKYADIEIFNDEEILATIYRRDSAPRIWEVGNRDDSIFEAVEQIRAHLSA